MEILSYYTAADPEYWLEQIGKSDWRAARYLHGILKEGRFRDQYGLPSDILLLADGNRLASFCTLAEKDEIPDTEEAGDADDADEGDDDASAAQEKDISSYWNPAPDAKGIRPSGRASRGVRAIKLAPGAEVVSMVVFKQDAGMVLTVSSSGLGKLTPLSRYRLCNRNCKGVISIKLTQHNGKQAQVVGVLQAQMNDQIVLITSDGILIRTKVEQIRVCGRFSQGVKLINIGENSELIAVEKVLGEDLENDAEIRGLNAPEGEAGAASGEVPENSAGENPAGETAGENDAEAAPSDAAEAQPETGDPATQE